MMLALVIAIQKAVACGSEGVASLFGCDVVDEDIIVGLLWKFPECKTCPPSN